MSMISITPVSYIISLPTRIFKYSYRFLVVFLSPLPNPQLWNGQTIGLLQTEESFANGGWWHDPTLLSATGQGMDVEEPKGWKGWWNENIVRLS